MVHLFLGADRTVVLDIIQNHILTLPNVSFVIVSLFHAYLIQCN